MAILNQISTILVIGFIYSIVALGVYITYKILDIPDLSVDGTFPLGGVVFAVLITANVPTAIAMLMSFMAGSLAGLFTGILHVKLKINGLLSGIITMTALLSINMLIAKKPSISFIKLNTMLNSSWLNNLKPVAKNYTQVCVMFGVVIICKIILDYFLKTKTGFMLRATGDNPQVVTQMGKNLDNYKMLGLSIANGLVALAGSCYCQYSTVFNTSMGTGTVVIALASVIIGCVLAKHIKPMSNTTGVICGSIFYYAILTIALEILGSEYTKLIVAILFIIILLFDSGFFSRVIKGFFAKCKNKKNDGGNSNVKA